MRTAVIGCGFIANTHINALRQQKQDIVLVVGSSEEKAKAFAEKWNIPAYSVRAEDAFTEGIDCVHICTPPTRHYEYVKQALLAGKHVICEKPMCLEAAQAKELAELAKEKQLLGAVNFNVRFHEACQRARQIIAADSFGIPRLIHGQYLQEFHIMPVPYEWRYIPEKGGKMRAVTEIGSHWIDLVRFWTGLEITEVSANFGCFHKERYLKDGKLTAEASEGAEKVTVDSEDAASVTLHFSNGAFGSLLLSEVTHGACNRIDITVSSDENTLSWCSEAPYSLHQAKQYQGTTTMTNAFGGGFPDTYVRFFEAVYEALERGEIHGGFPDFTDGYINAAVCEAVYESARKDGAWVTVR